VAPLDFLRSLGIRFGADWLAVAHNEKKTFLWLALALLIVLISKNTAALREKFRPGLFTAAWVTLMLVYSFLNLGNVTEFLYFDF